MLFFKLLKSLFNIGYHPSAGENATPWRLVRQALPILLRPSGASRPPLSLFFIINSRCNMRCQMCDVGQGYTESMFFKHLVGEGELSSDQGDFPLSRFVSLMEEVKVFKPYISLTSTEPLLYAPLPRAIEAVKSRGLQINVTSNGLLLAKRAEELFEAGLDSLTLSLDGPAETHDRIRGVPGAFARIREGLDKLIALKKDRAAKTPSLAVNSVISNLNVGRLEEMLKALPLNDLEQVTFTLMTSCTQELAERHNALWGEKYPATRTCLEGDCDPALVDTRRLLDEARRIQARYPDKAHFFFPLRQSYLDRYFGRPDEFLDGRRCLFPWFTGQVTARGNLIGVTRCYDVTFGNILDKPFLEVWNGGPLREFRQDLRRHKRFPACTRCEGVLY